MYQSDNCSEHQIDMKTKLTGISLRASLNSAGGIKFSFGATNSSSKEIKYVRFNAELSNAVGDKIKADMKISSSLEVEIIGPVPNGGRVSLDEKIIGYCDDCARIDINDVTLVYTDGTSETGRLGYYIEVR